MQLYPIYLLLVGYAVEVLIKGIIFSRDPSLLVSGEKLKKDYTHHCLVDLYRETGLPMDKDTEGILSGLEEFIVWKGRSAVPKNIDKYMGQRKFPAVLHDRAKIDHLVETLIYELNKIPSVAFTSTKLEFTDDWYNKE